TRTRSVRPSRAPAPGPRRCRPNRSRSPGPRWAPATSRRRERRSSRRPSFQGARGGYDPRRAGRNRSLSPAPGRSGCLRDRLSRPAWAFGWNVATTPGRARPEALSAFRERRGTFRGAGRLLVEGRRADLAKLAALAGRAPPDTVVELLHAIEGAVVGAGEPELEVAAPGALRAQAGSGPVGAADIDERAVD